MITNFIKVLINVALLHKTTGAQALCYEKGRLPGVFSFLIWWELDVT